MNVTVLTSYEDDVDAAYDGSLDGDDSGPVEDIEDRTKLYAKMPPPPGFVATARGLLVPRGAAIGKRTIVVPFPEGVNEGDTSDAVYAVKRAWSRKKGGGRLRSLESKPLEVRRKWQKTFSQEFGASSYTKVRHQKLAPWFDQKALSLLHVSAATTARNKQIGIELGWHNALYNRRFAVAYSQVRPSQLAEAARITRADCSGSVAGGASWAHILPYVDWRYTNTWSQVMLGREVRSVNEAIPGDIILYGSPSHVALYLGNGIVWSFGSYPIKILPYNYRSDRHSIRRLVPLPN